MDPLFSPAELAELQAYHAPAYRYALVSLVAWPLGMAATARWLTRPLYALAARLTARWRSPVLARVWGGQDWAASVGFTLGLFFLLDLVDLPGEIYFGFVREHAYGMTAMSVGTFAWDLLKGAVLTALSGSAVGFGLFGLARRKRWWWWVMGLVCSVAMVGSALLDPYRARVYVDQVPLPEGTLRARISSLMGAAGIDFRDVLVDQTTGRTVRLQAYFAGSGPTRTIVLNDALLQDLTEDEVLAAVAHEAGHVHESRAARAALSALALLAFLWVVEWTFRRAALKGWWGVSVPGDVRTLPLLVLTFELAMLAAAPASAAVARQGERDADAYALHLTHDPATFASLLVKAARVNKLDPDPPWWVKVRQTHPTIPERLEAVTSGLPAAAPSR